MMECFTCNNFGERWRKTQDWGAGRKRTKSVPLSKMSYETAGEQCYFYGRCSYDYVAVGSDSLAVGHKEIEAKLRNLNHSYTLNSSSTL